RSTLLPSLPSSLLSPPAPPHSYTLSLHDALPIFEPGDEVITVPFTFYATAAAVGYVGAIPVYVDIHPRTFNLDVARVEAAITQRDRKSTRLNSSHGSISYAVFCLKKKNTYKT